MDNKDRYLGDQDLVDKMREGAGDDFDEVLEYADKHPDFGKELGKTVVYMVRDALDKEAADKAKAAYSPATDVVNTNSSSAQREHLEQQEVFLPGQRMFREMD